ncbi:hypothetical protein DFH09DRAFT_1105255 [Mycena vulgaris]|nr:hypothetical protein DFH09DRAFT_1105255 [Mycena vulgaris]
MAHSARKGPSRETSENQMRTRQQHAFHYSMTQATVLDPTTEQAAIATNAILSAELPASFDKFVRAMLFPTGGPHGVWILVAVRNGVGSVDDVDYKPWISAGLPEALASVVFANSSIRVDRGPTGRRLRHSFSFIFTDQVGPMGRKNGSFIHPANNIINNLVRDTPKPWTGNVLAIQHAHGALGFEDFEDSAMGMVMLFNRLLTQRAVYYGRTSGDPTTIYRILGQTQKKMNIEGVFSSATSGEAYRHVTIYLLNARGGMGDGRTTLVPPMDWDNVSFTRANVDLAEMVMPAFTYCSKDTKSVLAWLIPDGTLLQTRLWVRVPIHDGLKRPTTIDDVNTDVWFDSGRGIASPTSDLTGRSIHVDRFPLDAPRDLPNAFTFVVAPQHTSGPNVHPVNAAIKRLVPDAYPPWRGNVLVFRHAKSIEKPIVDVEEQFWIAATIIISRGNNKLVLCLKARIWRELHNMASSTAFRPLPSVFWAFPDVFLYTLRYLTLTEIGLLCYVDQETSSLAKRYLKGRITRYTSPFFIATGYRFAEPSKRFFQVLDGTRSWVVGSIPLAVGSTLSDVMQPNNMNIITLHRHCRTWIIFLESECGYKTVIDVAATGAYAAAGRRYLTFEHPKIKGFKVTVTTVYGPHVGTLFFASPNTDQHIAISAYHIITPHLEAVSRQEHVAGLRLHVMAHPSRPKANLHATY